MTARGVLGRRRAWFVLLVAASTVAAVASPADGKPLAASGTGAVVGSVDGPNRLTVKIGRRTLAVRLAFVDTPAAGECGAAETQAALAGFVRRAPQRLRFSFARITRTKLERDADGRFPIVLGYTAGKRRRDLATDLVRAGWARLGDAATLDGPAPDHGDVASDTASADDESSESGSIFGEFTQTGVWQRCGGRLHLPASEPVPATAPAPWQISPFGVTERIGPLELPATLAPETTLTIRQLAELVPIELSAWSFGPCNAYVPSLQIAAWTLGGPGEDQPVCGDAPVHLVATTGPGTAAIGNGGQVGDLLSTVKRAFPGAQSVVGDDDGEGIWLPAPGHQWAWRTALDATSRGRVSAIYTYASPGRDD